MRHFELSCLMLSLCWPTVDAKLFSDGSEAIICGVLRNTGSPDLNECQNVVVQRCDTGPIFQLEHCRIELRGDVILVENNKHPSIGTTSYHDQSTVPLVSSTIAESISGDADATYGHLSGEQEKNILILCITLIILSMLSGSLLTCFIGVFISRKRNQGSKNLKPNYYLVEKSTAFDEELPSNESKSFERKNGIPNVRAKPSEEYIRLDIRKDEQSDDSVYNTMHESMHHSLHDHAHSSPKNRPNEVDKEIKENHKDQFQMEIDLPLHLPPQTKVMTFEPNDRISTENSNSSLYSTKHHLENPQTLLTKDDTISMVNEEMNRFERKEKYQALQASQRQTIDFENMDSYKDDIDARVNNVSDLMCPSQNPDSMSVHYQQNLEFCGIAFNQDYRDDFDFDPESKSNVRKHTNDSHRLSIPGCHRPGLLSQSALSGNRGHSTPPRAMAEDDQSCDESLRSENSQTFRKESLPSGKVIGSTNTVQSMHLRSKDASRVDMITPDMGELIQVNGILDTHTSLQEHRHDNDQGAYGFSRTSQKEPDANNSCWLENHTSKSSGQHSM